MKESAAGNSFVQHAHGPITGLRQQPPGELVGPSGVGVHGRLRTIRDRLAQGDDRPVCLDATTSTPASQNRASVVELTGITALAVKSPGGEMKEVCRPSKCQVAGPVFPGTKMLTARSLRSGTLRSTGSLTTSAPGGMVMDGAPPKVNVLSDPGTIDAAVARSAICAAPITRPPAPKVDSRTRTRGLRR